MARLRNAWLKALQDLGYSPHFISSQQIEQGELKNCRVLVLPESVALSAREADAIAQFRVRKGCAIFCNDVLGTFGEHGKVRPTTPLPKLFPEFSPDSDLDHFASWTFRQDGAGAMGGNLAEYRLKPGFEWPVLIEENLRGLIEPSIGMRAALSTQTNAHRYRLGTAHLLAFERNIVRR